MSKQGGLGDLLLLGGFNASGDINSIGNVGGGPAALPFTDITQSGMARQGGERDGRTEFMAYFNPTAAMTHDKLAALPTADVVTGYLRGATLGAPGACMVGKQINYDGSRGNDGSFTFNVSSQANGYGLEWGLQLTAGLRTDTAATNGTGIDTAASLAFGAQAYLQVNAFTGTDVTVKIQDSADNVTFADVTGLAFTQITSAPGAQRIATANTATIRRYIRASTVTTGGVTSVTFSVVINKNPIAGVTF